MHHSISTVSSVTGSEAQAWIAGTICPEAAAVRRADGSRDHSAAARLGATHSPVRTAVTLRTNTLRSSPAAVPGGLLPLPRHTHTHTTRRCVDGTSRRETPGLF
ncbi:unnamed protein product [Pleuronectes platessa]|uniref:Uncharacterized protein n=1 Tax=Pleuronectes platessa TaxID=8262 RepID=A0A9N7Y2N5_PLEPL|nr:unnamed protein product [Pleuronectes platessa]